MPNAWRGMLGDALPKDWPTTRLRMHPDGPALLLWGWRCRLLLPTDFLDRFDAAERVLVLRHELAHARRSDPLWSLLAEILAALCWFHPLVWLALPRLRLDQELACDETVLAAAPCESARYARALLRGNGVELAPSITPWLTRPQLKERLIMIERTRHGALRRLLGCTLLVALSGSTVLAAQAVATGERAAAQDLTYNSRIQPHYPVDAIKARQQGMVMLMVLVGRNGKPIRIDVDPQGTTAPDRLIEAAKQAAMQWRFNPAMKDGHPIKGYARVPVDFELPDLAPSPNTGTAMPAKLASSNS